MTRQRFRAAVVAATAAILAIATGAPPGAAAAPAGGPIQSDQQTATAQDVALIAAATGWGWPAPPASRWR